jgi:ABC-type nitrate/sulfonate/bicarbonate transport system ATPase subunit
MMLYLEDVAIDYGGHPVISSLDLRLERGEIFVLLGPSGSGKSTLLKGIAGVLPLQAGRLVWEEKPGRVGLVFQEPRLFPHLTVMENLAFGLRAQKVPKKERARRVEAMVETLQLAGLEGRYPHQLSGGQMQRVALGRVLVLEPDLLLLDEPFSSLDTPLRVELSRWLWRVQREKGFTVLWVTHLLDEAFMVADRMGVMMKGQILQVGKPLEVYHYPGSEQVARFFDLPNRHPRKRWLEWFPELVPKRPEGSSGGGEALQDEKENEMGWLPPELIRWQAVPAKTQGHPAAEAIEGSQVPGGFPSNRLEREPDDCFPEARLCGMVKRVRPERSGQMVEAEAGGVTWLIAQRSTDPVPEPGMRVELIIPCSEIRWYPRSAPEEGAKNRNDASAGVKTNHA